PTGSPLLQIAKQQASALQQRLNLPVALGMRYGKPSIATALTQLGACKKIIVLPLYPQYSAATTASTFDAIATILKHWQFVPALQFINHYATHPAYIAAITQSLQQHWQNKPPAEHLLFSFHGLPERMVAAGDPYYQLCQQTATLVAANLAYPKERWSIAFQS